MNRFVPRAVGALVLATSLGGCSFLARQAFAPPAISVSDVRLAGLGAQGGRVDVTLSLFNPNGYRIYASSIHYSMFVDSMRVADGAIDNRVTLMEHDSTKVRVPVSFGLREVMLAGSQLSQRGSLPFRVIGDVTMMTPFGSMRRAFEENGTYDGLNISLLPHRR